VRGEDGLPAARAAPAAFSLLSSKLEMPEFSTKPVNNFLGPANFPSKSG